MAGLKPSFPTQNQARVGGVETEALDVHAC